MGVLGLLGCTVDYLLKFSISVAIVAMVNNTHVANSSTTKDQSCPAAFNASHNAAATMVPHVYSFLYIYVRNISRILSNLKQLE